MARRGGRGLSERGRYWQGLLGAWARSGLTQTAFCRERGVKHVTFCWWKRQLARREGRRQTVGTRARAVGMPGAPAARRRGGSARALFAPVRIRADEPGGVDGRIEIVLGGGRRIRLRGRVDRQALAEVLAVLDESSPAAARRRRDDGAAASGNENRAEALGGDDGAGGLGRGADGAEAWAC